MQARADVRLHDVHPHACARMHVQLWSTNTCMYPLAYIPARTHTSMYDCTFKIAQNIPTSPYADTTYCVPQRWSELQASLGRAPDLRLALALQRRAFPRRCGYDFFIDVCAEVQPLQLTHVVVLEFKSAKYLSTCLVL